MVETEKKFKTKDMIICVFCTLLAILSIVFYFLPAFNVKHRVGPQADYEQCNYSAWEMTKAVFTDTKVMGSNMEGLLHIKDYYTFAVLVSGILMPLGVICTICTTIFSYLSWLKNEKFKQYCFLFSLCGMMFTTITLICTWFIAIQLRDGNNVDFFNYNLKGSISYASFISLILAFVVAIIACAYNYFLDNFDDEDEDYEDDDEEEEEEEVKPRKVKAEAVSAPKSSIIEELQKEAMVEVKEEEPKFVNKKVPASETKTGTKKTSTTSKATSKSTGTKTTSAKKSTTTKKSTTSKSTTAKKITTGKTTK